jgi:hypothetical protein
MKERREVVSTRGLRTWMVLAKSHKSQEVMLQAGAGFRLREAACVFLSQIWNLEGDAEVSPK